MMETTGGGGAKKHEYLATLVAIHFVVAPYHDTYGHAKTKLA